MEDEDEDESDEDGPPVQRHVVIEEIEDDKPGVCCRCRNCMKCMIMDASVLVRVGLDMARVLAARMLHC